MVFDCMRNILQLPKSHSRPDWADQVSQSPLSPPEWIRAYFGAGYRHLYRHLIDEPGDLEASVMAGTDTRGEMAVINSSRGIIYASKGKDFAEAARRVAENLRNSINRIRKKKET